MIRLSVPSCNPKSLRLGPECPKKRPRLVDQKKMSKLSNQRSCRIWRSFSEDCYETKAQPQIPDCWFLATARLIKLISSSKESFSFEMDPDFLFLHTPSCNFPFKSNRRLHKPWFPHTIFAPPPPPPLPFLWFSLTALFWFDFASSFPWGPKTFRQK